MKSLIIPRLPKLKQEGKGVSVYQSVLEDMSNYPKPHEFVSEMMSAFNGLHPKPDRAIHGHFFELVIGETLAHQGISYLYHQVEIRQVPLAIFDWFLYHEIYPVTVSCKTKPRDRWKQAAYEAMALKRVYSQSINYLVTIEEVSNMEKKKKLAPQAIDHFVVANKPEYDDAIKEIAKIDFSKAVEVSPIVKGCLLDINGGAPD